METIQHGAVQRPVPRPRRANNLPMIAGIGLLVGCCLIAALVLGYTLLVKPVSVALGPSVVINTPTTGQVVQMNAALPIQASATDPAKIKRIEVYADGALIAAQDSPTGGENPMILVQNWTPLTKGQHILVARAYPVTGDFLTSPAVAINVAIQIKDKQVINTGEGSPTINDIASGLGVPPQDIINLNPGLPPDPGAPLPPGTDVDVPVTPPPPPDPGPPPAPLPGTPTAPTGFTGSADCATASLSWTDSPDETSYTVYRLDAPILNAIATLPANSTNYSDPLPALGSYTYQVAAVKDGLEAFTPLVVVTTPGDCVPPLPPPIAIEDIILSLDELDTGGAWDGVYCYFDINGTGYQRVPASDFLYMTPEPDGFTYDLPPQLPDGGQYHVSADTSSGLQLAGQCWGKSGPVVTLLGNFDQSFGPETWDGSPQTISVPGTGASIRAPGHAKPAAIDTGFDIHLNIGPVPEIGDPPGPIIFPLPGWIDILFGLLAEPPPTDLAIASNLDGCAEFAGPDQWACVLGGLFTGGYPTVSWNWTPNAFHDEGHLTRYLVTVRSHDLLAGTDSVLWVRNVYRPGPGQEIRRAQILPSEGLPCSAQISVDVQAFEGTTASTVSTIHWQDTPTCSDQALVVLFKSLDLSDAPGFGPMHDVSGDWCFLCTDTRLEFQGAMGANWTMASTSTAGGDIFNPCPTGAWCMGPGVHDLTGFPEEGGSPGYYPAVIVFLNPAHDLTIWFDFNELDGGVASTGTGCWGSQTFPASNPSTWPGTLYGTHTITVPGGNGDEGQCAFTYSISAFVWPWP